MAVSMINICVLFLLIPSFHSVGVDYLDIAALDDDPRNVNNRTSIGRRLGANNKLIGNDINKGKSEKSKNSNPSDSEESSEEDDNTMKMFYVINKLRRIVGTTTTVQHDATDETSSKNQPKPTTPNSKTTTKLPVDIFQDYQYNYDYDEDLKPSNLFNNNDYKVPESMISASGRTRNSTKIDKNMPDFINLEPAAALLDLKKIYNKTTNNNVWYVPENYPCWELPLLFGEFGIKKRHNEVFILNRVYLKNVYDDFYAESYSNKILIDMKLNKWCTVPPCFGDHTLCLFSGKTNAQMCGKDYDVKLPTMLERIALVNTVNSIRNHVARGSRDEYPFLPPAANMKHVLYDMDLEKMSEAWLRQCLPGPAPCSALDSSIVSQLDCTKDMANCCLNPSTYNFGRKCTPQGECFIDPILGCIHTWFRSAGRAIDETDIECGHLEASTFNTLQLLWANTNKIGCAYSERKNRNTRVVCNFAPGAPFILETRLFCGMLSINDFTHHFKTSDTNKSNLTNLNFLANKGIYLDPVSFNHELNSSTERVLKGKNRTFRILSEGEDWGVMVLRRMYQQGWARKMLGDFSNGTVGLIARLVTKYIFREETKARCDTDEPVYVIGEPGSLCVETGRKFFALCYEFRDPTPGYRLVAVLAPVALFTLILYDLFSGVMRQAINN